MKEKKKYGAIEPISDKIKWTAHAALGDALNRCPEDADLFVVWMTAEGEMHWSKACDRSMAVYMMNAAIHKVIFDKD